MRIHLPTLLCLPVLCAPGLSAQEAASSGVPWQALHSARTEGVELQWRVIPAETGWILQFRNRGSAGLHFEWFLPGIEGPRMAREQGRLHLDPGARASFPIAEAPGSGPGAVRVQDLRVGPSDDGEFWNQ